MTDDELRKMLNPAPKRLAAPFDQGWDAFRRGDERKSPFEPGSQFDTEWLKGWDDQKAELNDNDEDMANW